MQHYIAQKHFQLLLQKQLIHELQLVQIHPPLLQLLPTLLFFPLLHALAQIYHVSPILVKYQELAQHFEYTTCHLYLPGLLQHSALFLHFLTRRQPLAQASLLYKHNLLCTISLSIITLLSELCSSTPTTIYNNSMHTLQLA